jgi:cellulose synthase/poly-beta-1,6-N-acetylglucosamine synthase-like glycosyltransferase
MLILFWASFVLIAYVYLGYPLVLWLAAPKSAHPVPRAHQEPTVSVIVAAHNEESCIDAKLRNLLALDYPRNKIEILIGSDGSSDRTDDIVRRYEREGVGLVSFPQQHGKSAMQNSLAAFSSGTILVFTDADCLLAPSALTRLLSHFADPRVGLVSACPRFRNTAESAITGNEGVYLRYETWIRERESALGVLAVASGSLFAVRRSLWQPLAPHFGDDFVLPLRVLRAGFANRLDNSVIASTDLSQSSSAAMFRMKTRIIAKDFRALLANRDLLNPFRYGAASLALWSHKLLRWLVPYFLLGIFVADASLLAAFPYRLILALQSAFYLLALIGLFLGNRLNRGPWSIPMSFCLVNFAALIGTLQAFAGRSSGAWTPERRSSLAPDLRSPSPTRVAK